MNTRKWMLSAMALVMAAASLPALAHDERGGWGPGPGARGDWHDRNWRAPEIHRGYGWGPARPAFYAPPPYFVPHRVVYGPAPVVAVPPPVVVAPAPVYAPVAYAPPPVYAPAPVVYGPAPGTVLGAIAGAAVGSTIGRGDGRTAAIAIGTVLGAAIGSGR